MALTIGELVGFIRADDSGWRRGITNADLRLRGFQRDADGRLRDLRGRFVDEGDAAGGGFGRQMLRVVSSVIRSGIGAAFEAGMSGLRGVTSAISSNPYVGGIGAALAAGVVAAALPLIGALLSGAVIAVGGLGIIGLGAALLKNEPEVKAASEKLRKTFTDTLTKAAQPLKKPLVEALKSVEQTAKDVAPQIEQAFRTVAESGALKSLTDGLDTLVKNALPGFNRMLTQTGPVFEGLESAMSDIGTGLGQFFDGIAMGGPGAKTALEDIGKAIQFTLLAIGSTIGYLSAAYGHIRSFIDRVVGAFRWLYNVLVGNSIVPDMINAVVRLFSGLPRRAAGALASFGSRIVSVASGALRSMVRRIGDGVSTAVRWLRGLPGRASSALSGLAGSLRSRAAEAGRQLVSAIRQRVSDAVSAVRGLPGRARGALGGLGGVLVAAGRSLISGFISGIRSMFGSVRSTLGDLTSSLTSWKGPEDVDKRILRPAGRLVLGGFMSGIDDLTPALRDQLQGLTRDVPGMALGGFGGAPAAAPAGGSFAVRVTVDGPEALTRVIRAIVIDKGGGDVQRAFGRAR